MRHIPSASGRGIRRARQRGPRDHDRGHPDEEGPDLVLRERDPQAARHKLPGLEVRRGRPRSGVDLGVEGREVQQWC